MGTKELQAEIDEKASHAPRVTPAEIEAEIASEHYFTAREGLLGMLAADGVPASPYERANAAPSALGLLTFCVLVLKSGGVCFGYSLFDHIAGMPRSDQQQSLREEARRDAIEQVAQRGMLQSDRQALGRKVEGLIAFIQSEAFSALSKREQKLLQRQLRLMFDLESILAQRIASHLVG